MSVYPAGVFSWTPRIDNESIVWANDPNSIVLEVIALEQAVGLNPQTEPSPPVGSPITYSSMSARLTAAALGEQLPFCLLQNDHPSAGFPVPLGSRVINTYTPNTDPFQMYNGTDVTIPCDGFYVFQADAYWYGGGGNNAGFLMQILLLNGAWKQVDIWRWDIPNYNLWPHDVLGNGAINRINWESGLHKGDRVQIMSINGTYSNSMNITYASLRCQMVRSMSSEVFISS